MIAAQLPLEVCISSRYFRAAWLCAALALSAGAAAAQALSWQQLRDQFEANNPALKAAELGVDEARAQEITAYLRPNPTVTATLDQFNPLWPDPYRPLGELLPLVSTNYLHEREGKRELRLDSAKKGTEITASQRADLERNLLFNLRGAFIQALQAKAVLEVAQNSLSYYDRVLDVSRGRLSAGDISQVDMQRLDLQRVQYESDVQTAQINVRNAKIQLLQLLNSKTPSISSISRAASITRNLSSSPMNFTAWRPSRVRISPRPRRQ